MPLPASRALPASTRAPASRPIASARNIRSGSSCLTPRLRGRIRPIPIRLTPISRGKLSPDRTRDCRGKGNREHRIPLDNPLDNRLVSPPDNQRANPKDPLDSPSDNQRGNPKDPSDYPPDRGAKFPSPVRV